MNFLPEKIQYDAAHGMYWTRVFYSAQGEEGEALLGATTLYLHELFKQPADVELGTGFMNKWLKIAMREVSKELRKARTDTVYRKMFATTTDDVEKGLNFLATLAT
jgi:hypothetical protein